MMVDVGTSEERIVEPEKKVSMLMKAVKKRYHEIASLKNYIESCDVAMSSHASIVNSNDQLERKKHF